MPWSFNRGAKTSQFVLGDFFEEKHLFWKKFNFRTFFGLRAKSFLPDFLKKTSDVSRGKISRLEKSFQKNHVLLGLCRSVFRKIGRNVLVRCSKLHFNCPEEHDSWKKTAYRKSFFTKMDIEQTFCESFAATFRQLWENCNLSVHRNILKEKCSLFVRNLFFLV